MFIAIALIGIGGTIFKIRKLRALENGERKATPKPKAKPNI